MLTSIENIVDLLDCGHARLIFALVLERAGFFAFRA